MDVDDYIEALSESGTLSELPDEELRELVDAAGEKSLHSGEPLWSPGEERSHMFVLIDGTIERNTKTHEGRQTRRYTAAGTVLSISALVHPWKYHSSAFAADRTQLLLLSRDAFCEMFAERRSLAYHLVDAIADYLVADMRQANARLEDVFGRPAETLRMLRRRVREDSKA